jgi:hypothetical protein
LYANFLNNGVGIGYGMCKFHYSRPAVGGQGQGKLLYGPTGDEAHFTSQTVVRMATRRTYVFTPHLDTWIDWKNAINAPNLPLPNLPSLTWHSTASQPRWRYHSFIIGRTAELC